LLSPKRFDTKNIDADANSAEMGQDSYTMNATGNDETIRTPSKHIINSNI